MNVRSLLDDCGDIGRLSLADLMTPAGTRLVLKSIMDEPNPDREVTIEWTGKTVVAFVMPSKWAGKKIFVEITYNGGQGIPDFFLLHVGHEGRASLQWEVLKRYLAAHPAAQLVFKTPLGEKAAA